MAEPSRSDPVKYLSNLVRTTPSFVSPEKSRSPSTCFSPKPYQVVLDQSSLESERPLATNVQDRAEFQYEVGLAHRRDQDVWPCLTHDEEVI